MHIRLINGGSCHCSNEPEVAAAKAGLISCTWFYHESHVYIFHVKYKQTVLEDTVCKNYYAAISWTSCTFRLYLQKIAPMPTAMMWFLFIQCSRFETKESACKNICHKNICALSLLAGPIIPNSVSYLIFFSCENIFSMLINCLNTCSTQYVPSCIFQLPIAVKLGR